ncbi:hypothetical protein CK203_094179 [Vitis vinifera]|uniref:Uncharacterized protein n=1 Tax=Vitis vinifera TaxID=29760 RepID=A0A438C2H9_VITVI|nr:hypothetical protein CK203_094179 [Vitis vinifera]
MAMRGATASDSYTAEAAYAPSKQPPLQIGSRQQENNPKRRRPSPLTPTLSNGTLPSPTTCETDNATPLSASSTPCLAGVRFLGTP